MRHNFTIITAHILLRSASRGPPISPLCIPVSKKYAGTALNLSKFKRSRLHQGADALGSVQV